MTASLAIAAGVFLLSQSERKVDVGGVQVAAMVGVTGVAANNSSAKIYFQPVAGAKDYRVYDLASPSSVKYAGLYHATASANCPGPYCLNHFAVQADGVTPVFPYQIANGPSGGPQVLDGPANEIEWNSLGDGQPHTLVVEAVDAIGPVPQGSLYTGLQNQAVLSPPPAGAMLGGNKGSTGDGNTSTNGQGPYTNQPQVLARSQPFQVQARPSLAAIPSRPSASQAFYDTFENAENATLKQTARQDTNRDAAGNLGSMTYSLNAGTPKEWTIEYRQADNNNSMPFISADHFMDMLFDGSTPGGSAPTHTIYGSMAMTPRPNLDMSGGKAIHLTMEVDGHQSFRRWLAFDLSPASDPLQNWEALGRPINTSDQGIYVEIKDGGCTLDIFNGPTSATNPIATGTAGGAAHGARLWGQAGSSGGGAVMCGGPEMFNAMRYSKNGFGLDERSRFDFYITATHAALFEDGQLIVQSDIPAGSFPFANVPLKAYYTHYVYHTDADIIDLKTFQDNGAGLCYPLNSYWFNSPLGGTTASSNDCNATYPAGYGFPYSDERHWDNMGFEVLAGADVPTNGDFSTYRAGVQAPSIQPPVFVNPSGSPTPTPMASASATPGAPTSTPMASATPTISPTPAANTATPTPTQMARTATPTPTQMASAPTSTPTSVSSGQTGQWSNVTPANANLTSTLDCGNFGTISVVSDPARPSNLYTHFDCQGIWKSTDYGQTWNGPINTGTGGAGANGAGGIAIAPGAPGGPPILYSAAIRGTGMGFWRSLDGGVSWTNYTVAPAGNRQDVYPPQVDPYDGNHLLMAAHELNASYQSIDGGQNWTSVTQASGMNEPGGTATFFFINTGTAASTRNTWLWMAQGTGGVVGTWRTANAGAGWTRVDSNEHPHGDGQIYQPDTNGTVYMAGAYSGLGWGALRSADYGQTWSHVGANGQGAIVFGTPNNVFSAFGWACGIGCNVDPGHELAAQPGMSGWSTPPRPAGMTQGPAQAAVVSSGSQWIILTANWSSGLWRYAETNSSSGPTPTPNPVPSPTPTPVQQVYTSSASVSPGTLSAGSTVTINALVKSTNASTQGIAIEVVNASGAIVSHTLWNSESFTAGQTKAYSAQWAVPTGTALGVYTVKIGVASVGWTTWNYWNTNASTITIR